MGLATLLEAMSTVKVAVPDVLLCIAGQGPIRKTLEDQVAALGLQDNVRFLGFVKETMLPHLYYAADFNVVPTAALEGFGLVAAEAMGTGTPSLVTPVGGLPEIVAALSPDLVFRSSSASDIADTLVHALRGQVALPTREACQQYITSNFGSALMAERTARVYQELL
jgi:glycosyltransferase involved in cell wall biosynthesis